MSNNKDFLKPGKIVEHKNFGESLIVNVQTTLGFVVYRYKIGILDGTEDWTWSSLHTESAEYFRPLS